MGPILFLPKVVPWAKALREYSKCSGSVAPKADSKSVEEALCGLGSVFVFMKVSRKRCVVLKVSRKRGRVHDYVFWQKH